MQWSYSRNYLNKKTQHIISNKWMKFCKMKGFKSQKKLLKMKISKR